MLEIDGSKKSGSGTILRLSIALAAITKQPLHIYNIRHNRKQPGLRPQHLESVNVAAKLCNAETKGVKLDSCELWFKPNEIVNGKITAEIGTAGSIPMLLSTVLPICTYSKGEIEIHVLNGGTDVHYSPTINYMKHVFLPMLEQMGLKTSLIIKRFGYYPKGMGEVTLTVTPVTTLKPITMEEFGSITEIKGISVCTFLEKQRVAERQTESAINVLTKLGYKTNIQVVNDQSNPIQKGSSLVLWTQTTKGAMLGADAIGERGKPSETVGKEAAKKFLKETEAEATVDIHLADMLVPYIALANGSSSYLTRKITDHIKTNIWLTEKILDSKFQVTKTGNKYRITKN
jgi:RNA 3'-terminal phosphate cyclase (ATP)